VTLVDPFVCIKA